jgi:hypothetical protein
VAAVTFDPNLFLARYPEFAAVNPDKLGAYFLEACLYLSNTDRPVCDPNRRLILFNMLVAHISYLNGDLNPPGEQGAANMPVGRTSSATEGTVNAQFAYDVGQAAQWFAQSGYGASFWQATLPYRSFHYRPRPLVIR